MSKTRLSVNDLPTQERPRYRAHHHGVAALSNAELLQIVANVNYLDVCPGLLSQAGSLAALARMSDREIAAANGLGEVAAARIRAAFELGRRLMVETAPDELQVRNPNDAAALLMSRYGNESQEHLAIVCLDNRNRVTGIETVYKGTVNTITIRAAEIFQAAVRRGAVSIIVCHNHPSGDPTPSPEDVRVTQNLVRAGKLMDVEVVDHLVVGCSRFVSLKERGLGFN
jgi:DNA repair protein RadC